MWSVQELDVDELSRARSPAADNLRHGRHIRDHRGKAVLPQRSCRGGGNTINPATFGTSCHPAPDYLTGRDGYRSRCRPDGVTFSDIWRRSCWPLFGL